MSFRHLARRAFSSTASGRLQAHASSSNVTVAWPDGRQTKFGNEFLLDHCRCKQCFHPHTKQRLKSLSEFPANVEADSIKYDAHGVHIQWSSGHQSLYPQQFLERAAYDPPLMARGKEEIKQWGSDISTSPPTVHRSDLSTSEGGLRLLDKLQLYGFCFVQGVPVDPNSTKEVIQSIGPIRETHYGGFWEFTANMSHGDLAYSSQALPAHTDTTYFTDPAGLQIFHLLNHSGDGGHTLLVDGFAAALSLAPTHFDTLSRTAIPFHASGSVGTALRPLISQPVLKLNENGELVQVRWNNEDRGVLGQGWSPDELRDWYLAARAFEKKLRQPDFEYWVRMEPGTMLVINNWRVLHGRSAFTGSRRMCGAYISGDDWRSKRSAIREVNRSNWDIGW